MVEVPVMEANLHPQAARGGAATTITRCVAELPVMQANLHPQAARGGVATTISRGAWLSWR
jgi:hypothetical protein